MESKQEKNRKRDRGDEDKDDQEMQSTTTDDQAQGARRIVKAKRRRDKDVDAGAMIDPETGEELEFEDDSDDLDAQCIDEQEVVHHESDEEKGHDDDWEDEEGMEVEDDKKEPEAEKKKKKKKKSKAEKAGADEKQEDKTQEGPAMATQIWNDEQEPLKEGEELEFDSSAYEMLHRAQVEWPCLSVDFLLKDRTSFPTVNNSKVWFPSGVGGNLDPKDTVFDKRLDIQKHKDDKYPMDVYFCGGSQSTLPQDNKIYVLKWSQMEQTLNEDKEPSDDSEDGEEEMISKLKLKEPVIRFESIPHRGAVNRIRSLHGSAIVATWNDEGEVGIFNVASAVEELDKPLPEGEEQTQATGKKKKKKNAAKKSYGGTKLAQFRHKQEGYALEWSPLQFGQLASGSNDGALWIYRSADENCSSFIKESQVALQGHKGSIEDIQWSPSQEHVLATCSSDQTVRLWDLRATQMKCQMTFRASDCDVNVLSWNTHTKFLLASGDDKGEFRIWDLRMLGAGDSGKKQELDSITRIRWHTQAITSIGFEPREESVLAVASADHKLTLWDFSVEVDDAELEQQNAQLQANGMDVPPQLMFLHQGQKNMKELRFHPQYRSLLLTTAEDSFNVFRPNLDPDYEEDESERLQQIDEEISDDEEAKRPDGEDVGKIKPADFSLQESDEDMEAEERRVTRTARELNKHRQARSKSKNKKRQRHN